MATKTIEFCGELRAETPKCWFIFDGINTVPVPKSQVKKMCLMPNNIDCILIIPEWLAKEKGII